MKRCPFCAEEIQVAAIVCKHCGRDLPAAPIAPPVLAVQRAKKPISVMACLIVGVATLGVIGIVVAEGLRMVHPAADSDSDTHTELLARVQQVGTELAITNQDWVAWGNTRIEINDRFKCSAGHFEPSEKTYIQLGSCVADDGTRFIPLTMAPVHVIVRTVRAGESVDTWNLFTFGR